MRQRQSTVDGQLGDGLAAGSHLLSGLGHVPAAAIVKTDVEHHARLGSCAELGAAQRGLHFGRQTLAVADKIQADPVFLKIRHFIDHRMNQQLHQARYFFSGTVPVLGGKRKNSQHADAALNTGFDTATQRHHALLMAGQARQKPLGGPAPVAIHDDGHVLRHVV